MAALRESCPTILYHACEGICCTYTGYAGALERHGYGSAGIPGCYWLSTLSKSSDRSSPGHVKRRQRIRQAHRVLIDVSCVSLKGAFTKEHHGPSTTPLLV